MKETGINPQVIRAGLVNLFQSPVFREALSCITGVDIHLYNTDGSIGAARGAGIGCGFYKSEKDAFAGLKPVGETHPDEARIETYKEAYSKWKNFLMAV
jgi:xylulokinase